MKIKKIDVRKIIDSRGKETIEVIINSKFKASAPSGTSRSKKEVAPFPKGIDFCINFLKNFKQLKNLKLNSFDDLKHIEELLSVIKGNALIAVEFAILKALSNNNIWKFLNHAAHELPKPVGVVIGGGSHCKGKSTDIQEFLLIPQSNSFFNNSLANLLVYNKIGSKLKTRKKDYEGAFISALNTEDTLNLIKNTIDEVSESLNFKIDIGLDIAASQLWNGKLYNYKNENKKLNEEEQLNFILDLTKKFNIKYIEDPFHENDPESYNELRKKCNALICGDDLTATNTELLKQFKDKINSVIVKPNQIGSLIKTKEFVDFARENSLTSIISHRSGETMDAAISHLAVAWQIPYIKCGIYGKERLAKINELKKIEKEIMQ